MIRQFRDIANFALRFVPPGWKEATDMRRLLSLLALGAFALAGCSSVELPGSALYLANKPGGPAFLKFSPGIGAPTLAVYDGAQWTPPRKMDVMKLDEPPITFTPGLTPLLRAAYRVDSYMLYVFKPDAKVRGETLPSQYFLNPGGFAYPVPAPKAAPR